MNIVVIGAGGVGGYFGGKLSEAGYKTTFLTRGQALENINKNGLQVKSILGDFHVFPKATNQYDVIKGADLIILTVKSWQIENIAEKIKPFLAPNATVLPLQNGADNAERLLKILGSKHVIAGLCRIVSKIEEPGIINHFGYEPEIVFGEVNNKSRLRLENIKVAFDKAGFKSRIADDIQREIWLKFLFICSISAMGALTRSVLGVMRENPFISKKLAETATEIVAIGNELGIDINHRDIHNCFMIIDQLDYDTTMSLQRDMMEGKPSELDNFNGFIVKQGDLLNIDTPTNDFIYYCLLPMEEKVRSEK